MPSWSPTNDPEVIAERKRQGEEYLKDHPNRPEPISYTPEHGVETGNPKRMVYPEPIQRRLSEAGARQDQISEWDMYNRWAHEPHRGDDLSEKLAESERKGLEGA